jgi:uncharacterized protein (DUF1778 family)
MSRAWVEAGLRITRAVCCPVVGIGGRWAWQGLYYMRAVVPIRLGDDERAQIAAAASRRKLTLSAFVREAALQASAVVEGKATIHIPEPEPERLLGLVVSEPEPARHMVDGEWVVR